MKVMSLSKENDGKTSLVESYLHIFTGDVPYQSESGILDFKRRTTFFLFTHVRLIFILVIYYITYMHLCTNCTLRKHHTYMDLPENLVDLFTDSSLFQTIGAAFGAKKIDVEGKYLTLGIWVRMKN